MVRLIKAELYEITKLFYGQYKKIIDTELLVHDYHEPRDLFKLIIDFETVQPKSLYLMNVCAVDQIPTLIKQYNVFVNQDKNIKIYHNTMPLKGAN